MANTTYGIILNVSTSSYSRHINQLQTYINTLVDQKGKLKGYRNKIDDIWKGESADSYKNTMDKQIAKVEQVETSLNKTLAAIQAQLQSSNTLNTSALSDIQDATSKIDKLFT